jgi:HD-GYP domain-containing protein (c-di-GMP phosphodiesterase class II)
MTTDRVYRPALSDEQAIAELEANSGTQFDPEIVAAVVKVAREREIRISASDGVRAVLAGAPAPSELRARTAS